MQQGLNLSINYHSFDKTQTHINKKNKNKINAKHRKIDQ